MKIENNFPLLHHNTFGIEAKCKLFVEYSTTTEITNFIKSTPKREKVLHIGGGSNLLFLNDFDGTILHSKICGINVVNEDDNYTYLKVGAGVKWDDFVQYCVDNNLYGAENLSYIPGEVGASPVQNVGAYGAEAKDIISEVEVINAENAEIKSIEGNECGFAYRYSNFKGPWKGMYYVLFVTFKLHKKPNFKLEYGKIKECLGDKEVNLQNIRSTIVDIRKDKLPEPSEIGSAGSFFTNPIVDNDVYVALKKQYPNMPAYILDNGKVKIPAGWLIEQCGWKGKNYKKVGVYEKQSLIIVNRGNATGQEVAELASLIQNDVKSKFNVEIRPEVCYI